MMTKKERSPRGLKVDGDLFRQLRKQCQWSQEETADRAGLSDKLVRIAEAGGPIQIDSIRRLAELYRRQGVSSLEARDFLSSTPAAPKVAPAAIVLSDLVEQTWSEHWQVSIKDLVDSQIVCHCELGSLKGIDQVELRISAMRLSVGACRLKIISLAGNEDHAACHWSLVASGVKKKITGAPRHGVTTARAHCGRIVELWDYWQPVLPMPNVADKRFQHG